MANRNISRPDLLESQHAWVIDPWIASSTLQKAIRRGDADLAIRAGQALHAMRGKRVFHRLAVIAGEDIGIAAPDTVIDTLAACADPFVRSLAGGDSIVLAHLIERLATAPKDRSADLLASIVHHCAQLGSERTAIAKLPTAEQISVAVDPARDLYERAVAAWCASGVEWGRERFVGAGDFLGLLRAMRTAGVPERWCVAVKCAISLAREPLFVMMLALWGRPGSARTVDEKPLPSVAGCDGLPAYALDKHTRLGLQALRRFQSENEAVGASLRQYVPEFGARAALNIATFYSDGATISRKLDWPLGMEIEHRGITTDLLAAGVVAEGVGPLRDVIAANVDHLNSIRVELLEGVRSARQSAIHA